MYSDYIRGKLYEESQIPRGQQYWMYYFQFITLYTSLIIICTKWEYLILKDNLLQLNYLFMRNIMKLYIILNRVVYPSCTPEWNIFSWKWSFLSWFTTKSWDGPTTPISGQVLYFLVRSTNHVHIHDDVLQL